MTKPSRLLGALALGAAVFTLTSMPAAEPGFKSLFNGADLTGWEGNPELWSVRDGAITGVTKAEPKLTHNTFLVYTNGDVSDFELRLSYRIEKGNSGIQYRSKVLKQGPFGPIVGGYQADFEAGKTYSGILYEEQGRGILAQRGQKTVIKEVETEKDGKARKETKVVVTGQTDKTSAELQSAIQPEDWNDYVIIAQGNHLQHFINGHLTADVTDEQPAKAARSGILALQIHVGPPMIVQFKNLRMKKLSGGAAQRSALEQLQGNWAPVKFTANGNDTGEDALASIQLRIKGTEYAVETKDGPDRGSFTLDESSSPHQMNVTTGKGAELRAIFEISGDTFKACYGLNGSARPTDFTAPADSDRLLAIYKRKNE